MIGILHIPFSSASLGAKKRVKSKFCRSLFFDYLYELDKMFSWRVFFALLLFFKDILNYLDLDNSVREFIGVQ